MNDEGITVVMMCFNPITLNYINEYVKQVKTNFLAKLRKWGLVVNENVSNYDSLIGAFHDLNKVHVNLQGKLDYLNSYSETSEAKVKKMKDYQLKFISISEEIKKLLDQVRLYKSMLEEGKKSGNTSDCTGMNGYRGETSGDGLNVEYYPTENFKGTPDKGVDGHINHVWPAIAAHPKQKANNFSVRWYGFITAPKDGNYTFHVESDYGAILKINTNLEVHYRINMSPIQDWTEYQKADLREKLTSGGYNEFLGEEYKTKITEVSEPIEMFQGQFYEIEVLYVHSIHSYFQEAPYAFIHLKWESMELPLQPIPKFYFYTRVKIPTIELKDYNKSIFEISQLYENRIAFVDSKLWRVVDVPSNLIGANRLLSVEMFFVPMVRFTSSQNVTIYVAYDWTKPSPLNENWKETGMEMSLLKLDQDVMDDLMNTGQGTAIAQVDLTVKRMDFYKGDVSFNLAIPDRDFLYLQIMVVPNPLMKNYSCGGKSVEMSNPADASSMFAGCESSSSYDESTNCYAGFGTGFWKADNEGVNGYLEIKLKDLIYPTFIQVTNDTNYGEMDKTIRVYYSAGRHYDVKLRQVTEPQKLPLKNAAYTDAIKLEVLQVYGTNNNGFNIKIFGLKCTDDDLALKADNIEFNRLADSKLVVLNCNSTLDNTNGIQRLIGDKTRVYCEQSCKAIYESRFFGSGMAYSSDSSLCRAAYYESLIGESGGEFIVEWGLGRKSYLAGSPKGKNCDPEEKNFPSKSTAKLHQLLKPEDEAKIKFIETEVVDFKDKQKCWMRGKISLLEQKGQTALITINTNGNDTQLMYPSKEFESRVGKCGTKYKAEKCDEVNSLSNDPSKKMNKEVQECNSYRGGDCVQNPKDCVFEDYELAEEKVNCSGDLVLIRVDLTSRCETLNCMSKCISKVFADKKDCDISCPYKCIKTAAEYSCVK